MEDYVFEKLKEWARTLKRDVVALWLAARDPRVPWYAKAAAGAVAAYALSPLDLIPDFIPVLGYLDDFIIVPLGIALVVRLIPAQLMAEFRAEAQRREGKPTSLAGLLVIICIWLLAAVIVGGWMADDVDNSRPLSTVEVDIHKRPSVGTRSTECPTPWTVNLVRKPQSPAPWAAPRVSIDTANPT